MRSFIISMLVVGLFSKSVNAQLAFTANLAGNSSSMINCSHNTLVTTYPTGVKPEATTVNHVLNKVYVPSINSNTITVINPCKNIVENTINVVQAPCGITVSPNGQRIYVCSYSSKIVQVIDANTYAIIADISVGSHPTVSAPFGIIVSQDNSRVYVGLFDEDKIAVIDALTNTVITYYATDSRVTGVDISRDGSKLYVANQNGNTLIVFNTATGARIATIPLGPPADPLGVGGAAGITLNYANTRAYVAIQDSSTVKVVDLSTNTVIKTIPVGGHPFGIDIVPDDTRVYVGCINSGTMDVINTSTNSVMAQVPVGLLPYSFGKFIIAKNLDSTTIDNIQTSCKTFNFSGLAYGANITSIGWQWDFGDGHSSNLQNPTHRYATTGTFTVKLVITDINGCKDSTSKVVSTFDIAMDAGPGDIICNSGSVTLQSSASGANQYSWTPAAYLNNPFILNPVATPPRTTIFYLTATSNGDCPKRDSVKIEVRSADAFFIKPPVSICKNKTVQLNASGGDIYTWSPSGSLNNDTIPNPIASPGTTTPYAVSIVDTVCGFSSNLSTTVTILPPPNIIARSSNDVNCSIAQSQLSATGAATYSWSPASTLNNPRLANPIATPTTSTTYTVTGTDYAGCSNTDTTVVKVSFTFNRGGGYWMPSAFTPNNDGKNDCYGIKYWGNITQLEFSIYNRWGERVFYTTHPSQCWDGKYKGIPQERGAFVYMIRANTSCNSDVFRKGTLVLIR